MNKKISNTLAALIVSLGLGLASCRHSDPPAEVNHLADCAQCKACSNCSPPGGLKGVITHDSCSTNCSGWGTGHPMYNANLTAPSCQSDLRCHADLKPGYQCLKDAKLACGGGKFMTCDGNGAWSACPP